MSPRLTSHRPATFHKMSVASVVIIVLITVTTLLLGGFGFVNYLSERTRQEAKLRHNLDLDAGQFSAALALPVWNFDRAQIDKVIESMMQDQTIYGVVVKLADAKNTVLARIREADGRPRALDKEFPAEGFLVEERDITFGSVTLGKMKLFVTTRFMESELKDGLASTFVKILGLDLILTISLYMLLWYVVLKPLRALEGYAAAVSSGNSRDLQFAPGTYQGELENLRTSIQKMIGLLDARYTALQKHEMMLLSVLDAVPQFIFWKDRDSVYLGCNKVFAQAVGLASPEEVMGKTDFDLPLSRHEAEADRATDREVMVQARARKHVIEPARLTDGTQIWVDTSKVPLLDPDGRAYGVLGVFEDITDQKRAEEALGRQLAFAEIIQWQLARFASSTGAEVDELILDCLRELAAFMGLNLAYVAQISADATTWSATHEWHAPEIPSRRHRYQNLPMNTWHSEKLLAGKTVRIERLDDLPPEGAASREKWEAEGFKSVFQVPLLGRGDRVKGSVGLISVGREATCDEADLQRLTMVSAAIANVLERQRAEEALRRSEIRYRSLFECAQDAIFINSGDCFIDCNPCALAMFGCRREQIIGQSPTAFSPITQPDGRDSATKAREKIERALAGVAQHFEWRHRRLDGTEFDAEVNLNRINLDHQSLMLGIVRDITERKRAEAAMRASEEKFSTAFRASPDPMSIVEWDSCLIVDTNEVFERCFGWSRQEVIGKSSVELGLWAEPEARQRFLAKLDQLGSVKNFQMVARTRKGRCFACLVSAEQVEINGKKSMVIVSQDITERQEMEDALRLSEDRFRSAMQHSPIGMALLAPEGRWLEVNPALCAIIGYDREELLALDFQTITHPEDLNADLDAVQQLLERKIESYESEKRYLHKEGRAIWIQLNVSLVWNPDGTQRNFVCQIQDVTERKRAEDQMQKSRQQLRALSARLQSLREEERTHLAREIHDHLGQLLTALKLDLRSIERKLPGLGDAVLIASLNGKLASARELTDETIKSIQQIASELRPAILDRLGLEAAIDAETQAFQARTGIPCESNVPENAVPTAPEQATAVFRVFQEILTNIARHAHASQVGVRLSREKGSLMLVVTDDGVGMRPSDLENPKSLGLLGMQERAEILGGHLRFGPNGGKGTTVTMSIPLNGKVET